MTEKQRNALRKWRVTEDEINKLDFAGASAKLSELISRKESRKAKAKEDSPNAPEPVSDRLHKEPPNSSGANASPLQVESGSGAIHTEPATYDVDGEMLKSKEWVEENIGNTDYFIGFIIAEHARQKFALWQGRQIQKMDLKKIKAYGKVG